MANGAANLSKIKPPASPPAKRPDRLTKAALDDAMRGAALERARLENNSLAQDIEQRRRFAERAFTFVCVWMIIITAIVTGVGALGDRFKLSDRVLITLLCTTTANVIGLLVIVMRYLFASQLPQTEQRSSRRKP